MIGATNNIIKFTDGNTWKIVTIEFDRDANLNEWKDVMKSIMVAATFWVTSLDFLDAEDE